MTARKIKWIQQPYNCCGQTCVAMLAGVTVAEVVEAIGKNGPTNTVDVVKALKVFGFVCPSSKLIRVRKQGPLPDNCILKISWFEDGKRHKLGHFVLKWEGKYYDPECELFIMPPNGKFTSYLPIMEKDHA